MGKFDLLNHLVPVVSDTHRRDTDIEKENERDTTAREEAEEADSFLDEKSQQSLTGKKRSVEKESHGEVEEEEGRRSLVVVPGLERPTSHMVCMHGRAKRERDVAIPQLSTKKKDAKKERRHNSTTTHNKERREGETKKDLASPPQPPTRKKDAKKGCGNP